MPLTTFPSINHVVALRGEIVDHAPEGFIVRIPDDEAEDGWSYGLVRPSVRAVKTGPIGWLPRRVPNPVY